MIVNIGILVVVATLGITGTIMGRRLGRQFVVVGRVVLVVRVTWTSSISGDIYSGCGCGGGTVVWIVDRK